MALKAALNGDRPKFCLGLIRAGVKGAELGPWYIIFLYAAKVMRAYLDAIYISKNLKLGKICIFVHSCGKEYWF